MSPQNTLIIVMRCADERTTEICAGMASRQVQEDSFVIVNERPFENALRKSYEVGIERGSKWTMTIDADVMLNPGSVDILRKAAELMPDNYIQLEGRVFDKILGSYRQAGHRIYRTELLPLALKHVPEAGREIRPEYFTLQQVGQHGHPSRRIAEIVGLHDFEQSYADLYRKSFVHARKHREFVGSLIERCSAHLHNDADFLVILKGLWDGLTSSDSISIDKNRFLNKSKQALEELGIDEKAPLSGAEAFIKNYMNYLSTITHEYPPLDFQVQDDPSTNPVLQSQDKLITAAARQSKWFAKARQRFEKNGPIKGSVAVIGALLKRIGHYLDK